MQGQRGKCHRANRQTFSAKKILTWSPYKEFDGVFGRIYVAATNSESQK